MVPDSNTFADSINSRGTISGGSADNVIEEAVLWNTDGTITNLGTGLAGPGSVAEAIAISNGGKIVGASANAYAEIPTGFSRNGTYTAPCGLTVMGYLQGVNDSGLSAGVMFANVGGSDAITCPPLSVIETPVVGMFGDVAFSLNNKGEVIGRHIIGPLFSNFHPFLYRNGSTTDLGTLDPGNPAAVASAFGINNSGAIVGFAAAGGAVHPILPINPRGYVFTHGQMIDLNSLLAPDVAANWKLVTAAAINGKGQIVGSAFVDGYPNGVEHGYMLSPPGLGGDSAKVHTVKQRPSRGREKRHGWRHARSLELRQSRFGTVKN